MEEDAKLIRLRTYDRPEMGWTTSRVGPSSSSSPGMSPEMGEMGGGLSPWPGKSPSDKSPWAGKKDAVSLVRVRVCVWR